MTPMDSREPARPSIFAEAAKALAGQPLRRAAVGYLMTLPLLLPIPFGGWRDWAIDVLALTSAVMLLVVAVGGFAGREKVGLERLSLVAVPAALYALMLIWAALQATHLPFLQSLWNPVWGEASAALGRPLAGSIALDSYEVWLGLVSLGAYAAVFLIAVYAIADQRVARMLLHLFIYAAALNGLYGLIVYFTGTATVLWFDKPDVYRDVVSGTFINRNNFAAYMGMALIAAIGLFLNEVSRRRRTRTQQAGIVVADRIWRAAWPLVVSGAVLAAALLLTQSRAGAGTTLAGIMGLCLILFATPAVRPFKLRGLLLAALALGLLFVLLSGGGTTGRIVAGLDMEDERFEVYRDMMGGIRDFLWGGTGLGSFEDAFRFYRSAAIEGRFAQAHNDVLEAVLELGIVGASAMFLALAWLVGLCLRELRRRRRGAIFPCIAVAVSLQLGLHSLLDFSMQVPAIVVVYVMLLACGLARADRDATDSGSRRR